MRVVRKKSWLLSMGIMVCFASLTFAEELVLDGNFEFGLNSWASGASSEEFFPVASLAAAHSGNYGVSIGHECDDAGRDSLSWISQNINIPRDALGATLTLWYQWHCTDPMGTHEYIRGSLGSYKFLAKTAPIPTPIPTPGWEQLVYNLPQDPETGLVDVHGQSLKLYFQAQDEGIVDPNYMFLDDVSLIVVTTATKTATPTISPTSTPTSTITQTLTITQTCTITPTYTITPTPMPTSTVTPWSLPVEAEAVAFPNPAAGDQVKFMYSLSEPARIFIDIYNLAGFKIARLEEKQQPRQNNLVTTWDIRDVAPGVYLYKISFETLDGRQRTGKIKRLVVAR